MTSKRQPKPRLKIKQPAKKPPETPEQLADKLHEQAAQLIVKAFQINQTAKRIRLLSKF